MFKSLYSSPATVRQTPSDDDAAILKVGQHINIADSHGWIICSTKLGKPFLVSPYEGPEMTQQEGRYYAEVHGAHLPSVDQLLAMQSHAAKGRLRGVFSSAVAYWSAEGSSGGEYEFSCAVDRNGYVTELTNRAKLPIRLVRQLVI